MKIIKNEKLIERNGKIGQYTNTGGLIVLLLGMYLSFLSFSSNANPEYFKYSLICLAIGFITSQISMYMISRWGGSPRPDEKFDAGLKGLHSDFNIFHYASPVPHLLVGPSGVWVLLPYHQHGKVTFEKNRWKISGGGFLQGYLQFFGQDGLGRPNIDAGNEIQTLTKFFTKKMQGAVIPEVKAILVFTNDAVELNTSDSPIPAMKLKQLKEFLRQGGKNRSLSSAQIVEITQLFAQE